MYCSATFTFFFWICFIWPSLGVTSPGVRSEKSNNGMTFQLSSLKGCKIVQSRTQRFTSINDEFRTEPEEFEITRPKDTLTKRHSQEYENFKDTLDGSPGVYTCKKCVVINPRVFYLQQSFCVLRWERWKKSSFHCVGKVIHSKMDDYPPPASPWNVSKKKWQIFPKKE